jgi:AcrR family transcriptional regulator
MPADITPDKTRRRKDALTGDRGKAHLKADTRALILSATAELAREKGAAHISIEAIAQRAGISKGGLLYHFPKKHALLQALVEQHFGGVNAVLADIEVKAGAERTNAVARAFVELNRADVCSHTGQHDGILLVLAENPNLLEPVRAHARQVVERVRRTASDRELSLIALLVIDGLRSGELFDTNHLTAEECTGVLNRLLALLDGYPQAPKVTDGTDRPPRRDTVSLRARQRPARRSAPR